ncbi:hypothetical protein [Mesorhizobium sp. M7A.F.Ce.TU.012.03.2.1]|uniref:hypothetical protein n=1 Tax=Mesorhizobium sp. M7A.F.Ce.TU.012.03.2.1 TaxID=2493681 RepID=UPI000FD72DDC|nr:hypothetical protein [Mesorhizobium sp. M7A.F.Ce.TU.012.03.2.1]AZV18105.1 hypothetical protein EJ079_02835 [Mesorhizobium sp. M7A.F.Ce.TU.012.03.2.1]
MIRSFRVALIPAFAAAQITASPAADIDFAEAFSNVTDQTVVVEVGSDDTLVFKGGSFNLDGKRMIVRVQKARVDANTVVHSFPAASNLPAIAGFGPAGPNGAPGNTWGCHDKVIKVLVVSMKVKVCERSGQVGGVGGPGAEGSIGAPANPIELTIGQMEGNALLVVLGNGQTGGKAQQGGKGGPGGGGINGDNRAGDAACGNQNSELDGSNGGQGGPGGPGGTGGKGGAGANLQVVVGQDVGAVQLTTEQLAAIVDLDAPWASLRLDGSVRLALGSPGGFGGQGGEPGIGGDGVAGGNAGKKSHCGGGGNPGRPGGPGPQGSTGLQGQPGDPGAIAITRR